MNAQVQQNKLKIHLAFFGDFGHGKSTLVGRLLYERKRVSEKVIAEYIRLTLEQGKEGSHFAWILDKTPEEREQGFTQDIVFRDLEVENYVIWAIDTPGHEDHIDRLIAGLSEADAGVLVVAAKEGITPQTQEYAILARILGIKQLIVAISKMDLIQYNQNEFQNLRRRARGLLLEIGYFENNISIVPVAALFGSNLSHRSEEMKWYNGPSFQNALNMLHPPKNLVSSSFRMPIDTIYDRKGVGTILCGKILTGQIKTGDTVIIQPGRKQGIVESIEEVYQERVGFEAGDNVGMVISGISRQDVKEGFIVGSIDHPPKANDRFKALISILHHPTRIYKNDTLSLHIHATHVSVTIDTIFARVNSRSQEIIEQEPAFLRAGEVGIVILNTRRPIVIETQDEMPKLSRFVLRDVYKTVAAGVCLASL